MANAGPFWFNVNYGNAESALFNADCWAVVLLDYIKERCGFAHLAEPVDLMSGGACINLRDVGKELATTLVQPKQTYTLCKVVASEAEGGPPTFESLWTPPEGQEEPPPPPAGKKK